MPLLFSVGLGTMTKFLETSLSLPVSLRGEEEEKREDRHAIMIIIIINVKQRQKRCGERETMITINMTAAGTEQRISIKRNESLGTFIMLFKT
jgi:hypothetical protein